MGWVFLTTTFAGDGMRVLVLLSISVSADSDDDDDVVVVVVLSSEVDESIDSATERVLLCAFPAGLVHDDLLFFLYCAIGAVQVSKSESGVSDDSTRV